MAQLENYVFALARSILFEENSYLYKQQEISMKCNYWGALPLPPPVLCVQVRSATIKPLRVINLAALKDWFFLIFGKNTQKPEMKMCNTALTHSIHHLQGKLGPMVMLTI